jgi:hypothetical protein
MSTPKPRELTAIISRFTAEPTRYELVQAGWSADQDARDWCTEYEEQQVEAWLDYLDDGSNPEGNATLPDVLLLTGLKVYPYRVMWQTLATALVRGSVGELEIPGVVVHRHTSAQGRRIRMSKSVVVRSRLHEFEGRVMHRIGERAARWPRVPYADGRFPHSR